MKKKMLKKILLGTLLIGLIGILVVGAVIRTMDKTALVAEAHGPGYGRGQDEAGAYAAGGSGQGRGGYAQGSNQGGYGGQGREDAPGDQTGTGQANVEEWLTLQGTIVSVDADTLIVQTVSGEQVAMENRPWWFAQEQGFSAQAGDQVTLIGFYEGGDFEVGQIDDTTNGQTVLVRDENGRPLWAGRGRQGS
jgi:maltose-binding protein MalE